jgi:hypothetical protein
MAMATAKACWHVLVGVFVGFASCASWFAFCENATPLFGGMGFSKICRNVTKK